MKLAYENKVIFQLSCERLIEQQKGRNYGEDMGMYLMCVGSFDA